MELELNGWWVPAEGYARQQLLPKTGAWQTVRGASGEAVLAVVLHGRTGWWDTNYRPVRGITEWLKPARWFAGPDDLEGDRAAFEAARRRAGSILRER